MKSIIVKHLNENRKYELHMAEMPSNAEEYFNEIIIKGVENWAWTGPGTAERQNEWVQVMD